MKHYKIGDKVYSQKQIDAAIKEIRKISKIRKTRLDEFRQKISALCNEYGVSLGTTDGESGITICYLGESGVELEEEL
jgi:hypothetical protein